MEHDIGEGRQRRLFYQVWDMPWLNGKSVMREPLVERKERLAELIGAPGRRVRYTAHVQGAGPDVFASADSLDVEGIVSKRANAPYKEGQRTREWQKVKAWRQYQLVVGGLQWDRRGLLEALLVGTPDTDGLRYDGRVEMGLFRLNGSLVASLTRYVARTCPFIGPWNERLRTWFRPRVSVHVRALPRRPGQLLRHAMLMEATA